MFPYESNGVSADGTFHNLQAQIQSKYIFVDFPEKKAAASQSNNLICRHTKTSKNRILAGDLVTISTGSVHQTINHVLFASYSCS